MRSCFLEIFFAKIQLEIPFKYYCYLQPSASGSKLKDLIIEKGIVGKALEYLHSHTPPKSFR